jgi:hypothetical protein
MVTAYALSLLVAVGFHNEVERRLVRLGRPTRVARSYSLASQASVTVEGPQK